MIPRKNNSSKRKVKREGIIFVLTEDLFPVQVSLSQKILSLRACFLPWIFSSFGLKSSFAGISHLSFSPFITAFSFSLRSLLLCNSTHNILSDIYPFSFKTVPPILSSPSRVFPCVFDPILLACCLTSIP